MKKFILIFIGILIIFCIVMVISIETLGGADAFKGDNVSSIAERLEIDEINNMELLYQRKTAQSFGSDYSRYLLLKTENTDIINVLSLKESKNLEIEKTFKEQWEQWDDTKTTTLPNFDKEYFWGEEIDDTIGFRVYYIYFKDTLELHNLESKI
ncbi:MAG: hypothetical protein RR428_06565 [Coprobacillus sp.]